MKKLEKIIRKERVKSYLIADEYSQIKDEYNELSSKIECLLDILGHMDEYEALGNAQHRSLGQVTEEMLSKKNKSKLASLRDEEFRKLEVFEETARFKPWFYGEACSKKKAVSGSGHGATAGANSHSITSSSDANGGKRSYLEDSKNDESFEDDSEDTENETLEPVTKKARS